MLEKNDFTKKEKKKKAAKGPNQRLRHRTAVLIVLILVIGFGAIVARLGYLTTIQSGKLQQAAVEQLGFGLEAVVDVLAQGLWRDRRHWLDQV